MNIRHIWIIFKKELRHYFHSPIGYVAIIAFLMIGNFWFMKDFFINDRADLQNYFAILPITLAVFVPAITMRSWAEERKSGTIEILMTRSFTYLEMITGKFLSSWLIVVGSVYLSISLPITVASLGSPDLGVTISGYIAASFIAGAYVALGQLISLYSKNQIVAFIVGICIFLILVSIGETSYWPTNLKQYIVWFGSGFHFQSIAKGLIDLRDVSYYVTIFISALLWQNLLLKSFRKEGA